MKISIVQNLPVKKIRRHVVYLILAAIVCPMIFTFALVMSFPDITGEHHVKSYLTAFFGYLIELPIVYFCAIKKSGTRWLTFAIWYYVISLAINILSVTFVFLGVSIDPQGFIKKLTEGMLGQIPGLTLDKVVSFVVVKSLLNLILTGIGVLLLIYYYVLRKRNNLRQFKGSLHLAIHRQAYALIDGAQSERELNAAYDLGCREVPHLKKFLKIKYKRKKLSVMSAVS